MTKIIENMGASKTNDQFSIIKVDYEVEGSHLTNQKYCFLESGMGIGLI